MLFLSKTTYLSVIVYISVFVNERHFAETQKNEKISD